MSDYFRSNQITSMCGGWMRKIEALQQLELKRKASKAARADCEHCHVRISQGWHLRWCQR